MSSITFQIVEHCGTLSEEVKGWKKELNLVSWNGREEKYDLRSWSPDKIRMNKGITLTAQEAASLKVLLNQLPLHDLSSSSDLPQD